ncbi:putative bifunctional diguanylate cyclase/phosphodiesterase [Thioalbus denitrificans]|uniref:cyclic-guanylate-specific phosphodiesterase n=1 Tax=Thioalbus denitrificans TaxID=547122 RepID=A0A369C0Q9_9GAMM|nr:EAL domain-containing protein [Thioalbus denitrificans]RCX26386.1 PAS domain S-box-containing protein/diguanylate cyclase (GGDEF)-like protein [Thioalbus denitrificans]
MRVLLLEGDTDRARQLGALVTGPEEARWSVVHEPDADAALARLGTEVFDLLLLNPACDEAAASPANTLRRLNAALPALPIVALCPGDGGGRTGGCVARGRGVVACLDRRLAENGAGLRRALEQVVSGSSRVTGEAGRLHRALVTLSQCNQALVRAPDEARLLERICQVAVGPGGYRMAWIGFAVEQPGRVVEPVAMAGHVEGYLERIQVRWDDSPLGQGPAGRAIRDGVPALVRYVHENPGFSPWREEALRRGYASVLALPLLHDGAVIGALCIYAGEPDAFDEGEVALLDELAADLSYGITALRTRAERQAADARMRVLSRALEQTADAVMITDAGGRIEFVNPAFTRITGYGAAEAVGQPASLLKSGRHKERFYAALWQDLAAGRTFQGTLINRRRDGSIYPEEKTITPLIDGSGAITHYISTGRDITRRLEDERLIRYLSSRDPLTGLPNRAAFLERIDPALRQEGEGGGGAAVVLLDVDRFKMINDTLGPGGADRLLRQLAERLGRVLRPGDMLARLGSDEFAILLGEVRTPEQAMSRVRRLQSVLASAFQLGGHELFISAGIGVSLYPHDGIDGAQLLGNAEAALHRARLQGRAGLRFYTADIDARAHEQLVLEADLRRALERRELRLHYQPQLDLQTGAVVAVEALLRWQCPRRGLVAPMEFIPLLEETGLIGPVGDWVLAEACRQASAWHDAGLPPLVIAVNLSPLQLEDGDLAQRLQRHLEQARLQPERLELEITETTLMRHGAGTLAMLESINRLGVQLALDDFGTGYSSLGYLTRFPLHTVKIDRSFVSQLPRHEYSVEVVRAIAGLAHGLGLTLVAEGVEQPGQVELLRELGCHRLQGFLFARPLPAEALSAWIAARN